MPQRWLPVLTIAWGICATLQGMVTSRDGFFAARFFMGVSEAGLFPGCIFVFSMFYKRNERHWRVAVFFGGAAMQVPSMLEIGLYLMLLYAVLEHSEASSRGELATSSTLDRAQTVRPHLLRGLASPLTSE